MNTAYTVVLIVLAIVGLSVTAYSQIMLNKHRRDGA